MIENGEHIEAGERSGSTLLTTLSVSQMGRTTDPKISVVIPAYDEEKYLPSLLESLSKQTYPKDLIEVVVVVDHRSTDDTGKIARDFGAKIVIGAKPGVSQARSDGFSHATGEIIASTDADSRVATDWVRVIADTFRDHTEYVGITGPGNFYDGSELNKFLAGMPYDFFQKMNLVIGLPSFPGFNFAVRAEAYRKSGGFNPNLKSSEDVDLSLKLKKIGKLAFIPQMKVWTSARRIENQGRWKFFRHHMINYLNFTILRRNPEGFENIR
jgi:glycosyltransferase involved in cell wall biosynthesis